MSDRREICHRKCHTNRDSGGAFIVSGVYDNNLASDLPPVSGTDASIARAQTSAEPARSCDPAVSALSRNFSTENATPAPRPVKPTCPRCDGWGRLYNATGGEWFDCEECGGTGDTPAPRPEALPAGPFYHGGKRGLGPGDWLVPSPPHKTDGCPICVARAEGRSFTVGEMRAWAARIGGQQAERLLAQLECADDAEPIDPPTGQQAVYVTSDRDYAAWYAARSEGDLYRVTPVGAVTASPEDHFPTWTCARARVLEVVRRKVRLRDRERRRLLSRWKDADAAALAAVERAS